MIILVDKLLIIIWWIDKMFEIGLKFKLFFFGIKLRNKKVVFGK